MLESRRRQIPTELHHPDIGTDLALPFFSSPFFFAIFANYLATPTPAPLSYTCVPQFSENKPKNAGERERKQNILEKSKWRDTPVLCSLRGFKEG